MYIIDVLSETGNVILVSKTTFDQQNIILHSKKMYYETVKSYSETKKKSNSCTPSIVANVGQSLRRRKSDLTQQLFSSTEECWKITLTELVINGKVGIFMTHI